jgi:iron complex outermembrane receptor protein
MSSPVGPGSDAPRGGASMDARTWAVSLALALLMPPLPAVAAHNGGPQAQQPQPPAQPEPPQRPQPPPPEEQPPVYEEQVIVSATRVEQQLVNAPATVSVISTDTIASTPANNYAELMRTVPGVNISQTSARDINITMRSATSTLSTSVLAVLDGRSLYLDFFGFVAWDMVPMNPTEIRQIEVIRGPASAIWGASALSGVVNFISRSPRELAGDSLTISAGAFDRSVGDNEAGTGGLFSVYGTHARAPNDRWAYKVSAGYYGSDAYARPTGTIPNGTGTPYPSFPNEGTAQPKFDTRVDYDAPDGSYKLTFAGGYAGTEGIIHTGIGPFDMNSPTGLGYGTVRYSRGALRANFFTNILNGNATGLLAVGLDGRPLPFSFDTKTFDWELGNVNTIGTRQVLSYGGNFRYNQFDLSIAPRGDNRVEGGIYGQDEFFINDYLRLNLGARIDMFDVIDNPVFSPRIAFIVKPRPEHAIRVSYNKAFRAPSLVNNFLDTAIVNQVDLNRITPVFPPGTLYAFPIRAVGYEDLKEESVLAWEIGYTGVIRNRATVSAAWYWNKNEDGIFFTQTNRYRATNPPPRWPLPPAVLELLPPPCLGRPPGDPCTDGGLPSEFSYRNLGQVINKGIELGIDAAVNAAWNVFANYSYQTDPDPDFDIDEVNLPPNNRFNVGFNYSQGRYLGNLSISYVDDAFWQDVLGDEYHGPTDAYTQVNGAFGVRWNADRITSTIKVINLFNQDIQSHVFGDILKIQVIGELRFQF